MIKIKPLFIFLLSVLIFAGCFHAQKRHNKFYFPGKYQDKALSDNRFEIFFTPNDPADTVKVRNLTLLRCATVTLKNGYKYFFISDQVLEKQLFTKKSTMKLTITCFADVPKEWESNVFDAKAIKIYIQDKYNLIDYKRP